MTAPTIAVVNESSVWTDAQVKAWMAAAQVQVDRDFEPVWNAGAHLQLVDPSALGDNSWWWLVLLDDADQANALGYHEMTDTRQPIGKVFCKTTADNSGEIGVVASHELLEMLVDPHINLLASQPMQGVQTQFFAYEVCDACEDDRYAYKIGDQWVSDFVYPEWFIFGAQGRMNHSGMIRQPLQILPGGYIGTYVPQKGWGQLTGDAEQLSQYEISEGTRRYRRITRHITWRPSLLRSVP